MKNAPQLSFRHLPLIRPHRSPGSIEAPQGLAESFPKVGSKKIRHRWQHPWNMFAGGAYRRLSVKQLQEEAWKRGLKPQNLYLLLLEKLFYEAHTPV